MVFSGDCTAMMATTTTTTAMLFAAVLCFAFLYGTSIDSYRRSLMIARS